MSVNKSIKDSFLNIYQTISRKSLGLSNWMLGFSILISPAGWATTLLVEILCLSLLASVFFYVIQKIPCRSHGYESRMIPWKWKV